MEREICATLAVGLEVNHKPATVINAGGIERGCESRECSMTEACKDPVRTVGACPVRKHGIGGAAERSDLSRQLHKANMQCVRCLRVKRRVIGAPQRSRSAGQSRRLPLIDFPN